jgi:putative phage-type endonuclease
MVTPVARQIAPGNLEHTDRTAWLELRRRYVCASDVPLATGAEVYGRTRWQLYVDKRMGVADTPTERQAEQYRFGHRMEAVAAAEWRDQNPGTQLARLGMLESVRYPWLAANLDRRVYGCPDGDGPCGWECKNRGQYAAREWDLDGDPDAIPDAPMIQTQAQMIVTGWAHIHLAVVIGGNELRPYRIDADEVLQKLLVEETKWFWYDCVQAGKAPPIDATERTGHILARLWDVDPAKVRVADPDTLDLIGELRAAVGYSGGWAEEVDRLKHELAQRVEDAEAITDPATGKPLITWKQNGTLRENDFRRDHPDLWDEYAEPAEALNTARLARERADIHGAYRARVLRICGTRPAKTTTTTEGTS